MERFFKKYAPQLGEDVALKMIDDKLGKAIAYYESAPSGDDHVKCLKEAQEMISDYLECKG